MKKHIDFVIADNQWSKKTFRFYPRASNVHGFHDEAPKNWEAVYKVYFAFSILEWHKDEEKCEQVYVEGFDECSCIDEVAYLIRNMNSSDRDDIKRCRPSGDGTCWLIEKFTRETWESMVNDYYEDEKEYESFYDFFIWHTYDGKGYKFQLPEEEAFKFADVIDEYRQYMLEHSQGI